MTDASLLSLAKQGDPKAIASLINQQLQPKGITARAALKGKHLQILLMAEQIPHQPPLVNFIHNGITKLACPSIEWVKVYGLQQGEQMPAWSQVVAVASSQKTLNQTASSIPASTVKTAEQQESQPTIATENSPQQVISETHLITDQLPAAADTVSDDELPDGERSPAEIEEAEIQTEIQLEPKRPATYKRLSILLTLFSIPVILTLPFGIIALIFASQAASKQKQADDEGAKAAAQTARKLCIIGACVTAPAYLLAIAGFSNYWMQAQIEQIRAAESDATSYINSFNVNQMVYQAEHKRFASSFEDLKTYSLYAQDETNAAKTDRYDYSILVADETKVVITATAKEAGLRSFTGSVHALPTGQIEAITCQTNTASDAPPEAPALVAAQLQCPTGSSSYSAKKSKGDSAV